MLVFLFFKRYQISLIKLRVRRVSVGLGGTLRVESGGFAQDNICRCKFTRPEIIYTPWSWSHGCYDSESYPVISGV